MKILISNFLFKSAHRRLDEEFIKKFSEFTEVICVCPQNWYRKENGVRYIEISSALNDKTMKHSDLIMNCISNIRKIKKIEHEIKPDFVLLLEVEILFTLFLNLSSKTQVGCVHHQDLDSLDVRRRFSRTRRIIFKNTMQNMIHIVMEDYMCNMLINQLNIKEKKIFVLTHPIVNRFERGEHVWDCVALSHSNDEQIITELIEKEKRTGIFKNNNIHVLLRSHQDEFDNGYLKVINHWLGKEEYDRYIAETRYMFVPLPNDFNNRVSGVIIEALGSGIPVITTKTELVDYYIKKYPNICFVYENDGLIKILTEKNNLRDVQADFERFTVDHNTDQWNKPITDMIEVVNVNKN